MHIERLNRGQALDKSLLFVVRKVYVRFDTLRARGF